MRKKVSAKCWLLFISCAVIGMAIAWACAGGDEPEYGNSNFTPEAFVDSSYSPFFWSDNYYYGIGHEEDQNERFNNDNALDWYTYLKNQVPIDTLHQLLEKSSQEDVNLLLNFVEGKEGIAPAAFKENILLSLRNNPSAIEMLKYLSIAKQCEYFAVNTIRYSWDDTVPKDNTQHPERDSVSNELATRFSKAADPFIKERYWFQLVRSYFFNNRPQLAVKNFTDWEKQMPHNIFYFRTASYAAGAYHKMKDFVHANYLYSRVYDECNEMKTAAHYSFHPQEEKDWLSTLSLCRNNEEKTTLWQMLGVFYADEGRSIHEIYQLDPQSDKLELLLSRVINGYEQKFVKNPYEDQAPHPDTVSLRGIDQIFRIANNGNTSKPWVWYLAAGYIHFLDSQYVTAAGYYAKAAKLLPDANLPKAQWRLLQLINTIGGSKIIDHTLEEKILPGLKWIRACKDSQSTSAFRTSTALEWITRTMGNRYAAQRQWEKSECFYSQNIFYANPQKVDLLKAFLANKKMTPFEQVCRDYSKIKLNDILEYQSIQLAFSDHLDGAIDKMMQSGITTQLPGNPFNSRIQDCHDCDFAAPQKIKYSKLSFLEKMRELEKKIQRREDVYNNSLLLANGFYNITHYGNARVFYECNIIGSGQSQPNFIDSSFRFWIMNMDQAKKYYQLALAHAENPDQHAKCVFQLAKCERNQWYSNHIFNTDDYLLDAPMVDLTAISSFRNLKSYAKSSYYQEALKECGYFRTFLKR